MLGSGSTAVSAQSGRAGVERNSEVVCADEAATLWEAGEIAASCGREVVVTGEHTAWTTTSVTPSGTTRWESSTLAVRADADGDGQWAPIDANLAPAESGGLRVVSGVADIVFTDGTPGVPLASITQDPDAAGPREPVTVELDLPEDGGLALGTPEVSGARATFVDVVPGADLALTVNEDATGFGPTLVVRDPAALDDAHLDALQFEVSTSEGLDVVPNGGGFAVTDSEGSPLFVSPEPVMWDSAGSDDAPAAPKTAARVASEGDDDSPQDGEESVDRVATPAPGDQIAPVGLELDTDGDTTTLTLRPDAELLNGPDTVFPVHVDPDVEITAPSQRTTLQSAWPNSTSGYQFAGDAGVGYCDRNLDSRCAGTSFVQRTFYQYQGLPFSSGVAPGDVTSATLHLYGTHSYDCSKQPVEAWVTGGISSTTTWATQPVWNTVQQRIYDSYRPDCGGQHFSEFNVLAGARLVAEKHGTQLTFGVRGTEQSMVGWKRYYHAQLSIEYNRAPRPAGGMTIIADGTQSLACTTGTGRAVLRDTTPRLSMVLQDPDGDALTAHYEIYDMASGAMVWQAHPAGSLPSGRTHTVDVPSSAGLTSGRSYRWHAAAHDPAGRGGTVQRCEFTVDRTGPNTPTIQSKNGVYPEGRLIDVAGDPPREEFILGRNGSTDVVKWRYAFNTDALGAERAASPDNGSLTVAFTPAARGPQVLYAQSIDKAGNPSQVRRYLFGVDFPSASGLWHLDDGAGGTARDSVLGAGVLPPDLQESATTAHPLSLSQTTKWGNDLYELAGEDPTISSLTFDNVDALASSAGLVVDTSKSFTVSAFLRPDSVADKVRTAVSQDGIVTGGFKLGTMPAKFCGEGQVSCWGFWMPGADATGAPVSVVSDRDIVPGQWVHVTGVHNATTHQIQLYVCGPDPLADWVARVQDQADFTTPWPSGGKLRVGNGKSVRELNEPWVGGIDDVRIYATALTEERIQQVCGGQQVS
jgi:hypothetical protein